MIYEGNMFNVSRHLIFFCVFAVKSQSSFFPFQNGTMDKISYFLQYNLSKSVRLIFINEHLIKFDVTKFIL